MESDNENIQINSEHSDQIQPLTKTVSFREPRGEDTVEFENEQSEVSNDEGMSSSRNGESFQALPRTKSFIKAASTTQVMPNSQDLKTIGFVASLSLMTNNMIGPALVATPVIFQQAGWVTPTLAFLFIMVASSIASTALCDAMSRIPGNEYYQGRIEMVTLVRFCDLALPEDLE